MATSKVILKGPFPTADETADRLGLTRAERRSVNRILRKMQKDDPGPPFQLLKVTPGRASSSKRSRNDATRTAARTTK